MNQKYEFIDELRRELIVLGIHNSVVNEIVTDIEEYFENSKLDGKPESDVFLTLGSPYDLAQEYIWLKGLEEKRDSIISIYASIIRKMPKMIGNVILNFGKNIFLIMLCIISVFFIISGALCIIGTICSFFNINGIVFEGVNIWGTRVIITILGLVFIRYGYKFAKDILKEISKTNKLFISSLRKKVLKAKY